MRKNNLLVLLLFSFIVLLVGCSKKTELKGILIDQIIYKYDNNDENNLSITDGDIIELDEIENGVCSILCKWEYLFKNYSDISEIPEIKYYKNQGIIYYIYFNDELIETNRDETITELEKAQIRKINNFFKVESISTYTLLFSFEANQYGRYHVVFETNLLIDEVEKIISNELYFTIIK